MLDLLPDFSTMTRGQKRSAVAMVGLFFTPFLILMLIQIYNALMLSAIGADIANAQNQWKAEAMVMSSQVEPASLKSAAAKAAFPLVARQQDLLPERQVTLIIDVALSEMRRADPSEKKRIADRRTEAAAQTQSVGQDECARLVRHLARECVVLSATGKAIGEAAFQYQLRLAFVESEAIGKTDPKAIYEFTLSRTTVAAAVQAGRIHVSKSAAMRDKIYAEIASTCRAMRKKAGTCSVTGLSLSARLEQGLPMLRMAATASYASLVKREALAALSTD